MLELTSQSQISKSKLKKLRRLGLIEEGTELEKLFQINKQQNLGLKLEAIKPKTLNQARIFREYAAGKNLLIHGLPGTGKTFIALYLALNDVLNEHKFDQVAIYRSAVETRKLGFLPGSDKQKIEVYEAPYRENCRKLFRRSDAYEILKNKKIIAFESTSFVRGLTLDNSIVIVDEAQNCSEHELDSLITRLGDNSKIFFCGDYKQSDLRFDDEKQGLLNFMEVLNRMESFAHVEMKVEDIVRSGIVREYIIARNSIIKH